LIDLQAEIAGRAFCVFGACGFIGGRVVKRLLDLGASRCFAVDNLFTGVIAALPNDARVEFVHASVCDQEAVDSVVALSDFVLNLATVNIVAAQKDPELDLNVNAFGALRVVDAVARAPRVKRVLYTSSASVYGGSDGIPVCETGSLRPMSNYAVSKLAGEHYVIATGLMREVPVCVVRYSNVYGPGQRSENPYCGVIGRFFASALAGMPAQIHGSGTQTRDFTFVDDVVEATLLALVHPRADGEVFNVASGCETSVLDVARLVFSVVGRDFKVEFIDRRDIDNISRRVLGIEKARTRLRWEPRHSLVDGIAKSAQWYTSRFT
jgi:UDP-glucose 4-epimerase